MTARYWVDAQPEAGLDPALRAVQYGDGLFETLCVRDAQIAYLDRHLQRLRAGCKQLRLEFSDWPALLAELQQHARDVENAVIKIILSRGVGGRGYRFDPGQAVTRIVSSHPLPAYPPTWGSRGVHIRLCELRLGPQPRLAGIKHLNRLEQVMARSEWGEEYEEGLMLDYNGHLVEGTMTNVFIERDGVLLTPRLDECGVAGVMRSVVLDLAGELGVEARRQLLRPAELGRAQGVFLCNSLAGIWPVISVAGLSGFSVGPLTQRLQQALAERNTAVPGNWYSW